MLVKLISWPYLRMHLARCVLTVSGVALGVSLLTAMRTTSGAVLRAFTNTVDKVAGKTELQVSAGEAGFSEEILERVQASPSVRLAVPVVEAVIDSGIPGQGSLLILGIDMTGDRGLRDYDLDDANSEAVDDPLIFLAQPDSLILSRDFAARNGIARNQRLTLGTAEGTRAFTVRGLMSTAGLASAFGGNVAIMDIYAAQKMFGRGWTFDRIDLAVKPGASIEGAQSELQALLGSAFDVRPPSARGRQFENLLSGYNLMVNISSGFALFIGMFIIYHSFSIAISQRRKEIGVLRALGASRRQIAGLFLTEGACFGLVGSLIGVVVGMLIAQAIASSVSAIIADVYGVAQRIEDVTVPATVIVLALSAGVTCSVLGALQPATIASRLDPIQCLRGGVDSARGAANVRSRLVIAGVTAIVAILAMSAARRDLFYFSYACIIVSALSLTPMFVAALSQLARRALTWYWPIEGALAADALTRVPANTSATVAALMLSLALVVGFAGMAGASVNSIVEWMDTSLNADLFVTPTQSMNVQTMRFPAEMADELRTVAGIGRVELERDVRVPMGGQQVMLVALEFGETPVPFTFVSGSPAEAYRQTATSRGVLISDNLAELRSLSVGDVIDIPAPVEALHVPIVGVVVDYSDQQGSILLDRRLFIQHWNDDSVSVFRVHVADPADTARVRTQILERFTGKRQLFVLTNGELKSYIRQIVEQWFGMTRAQIVVAVVIAILGIFNTLTVSILDRRRELAVVTAIGALRRQVRMTIWLEAITLAAIGLVLGFALGAINLHFILDIARRDISGTRLVYEWPFATTLTLVPLMLGAGWLASLGPAESAVRGSLIEALEYE